MSGGQIMKFEFVMADLAKTMRANGRSRRALHVDHINIPKSLKKSPRKSRLLCKLFFCINKLICHPFVPPPFPLPLLPTSRSQSVISFSGLNTSKYSFSAPKVPQVTLYPTFPRFTNKKPAQSLSSAVQHFSLEPKGSKLSSV